MSDLINRAMTFSRAAHQAVGQRRKYTEKPYYLHPRAVAAMVKEYGGSENMIAAALLHDVLEDTQVLHIDLAQEFNTHVMALVYELTDQFTDPAYGNRAYRKSLECARLAGVSPEAQTIKYADLIDNTSSIVKHDPDFAKVYLLEKRSLLESMVAGNQALWNQAMNAQEAGMRELAEEAKKPKLYKNADCPPQTT